MGRSSSCGSIDVWMRRSGGRGGGGVVRGACERQLQRRQDKRSAREKVKSYLPRMTFGEKKEQGSANDECRCGEKRYPQLWVIREAERGRGGMRRGRLSR